VQRQIILYDQRGRERSAVPRAAIQSRIACDAPDDLIPPSVAHATVQSLGPHATLVPVPNAGHNTFWEQPSIVFPAINTILSAVEADLLT
jgi:pimeloyl-ACP methyl ester carboxylesterase